LDKIIFYLVLDKFSANDTYIKELFNTSMTNELSANNSIFHQRCGYHILNLIIQDGLDILCDEIKNIRKMMKYIRYSQSRMEKFKLAASQVIFLFRILIIIFRI
jgi:hypothetical protein